MRYLKRRIISEDGFRDMQKYDQAFDKGIVKKGFVGTKCEEWMAKLTAQLNDCLREAENRAKEINGFVIMVHNGEYYTVY
jgi:hypothetical protein